MEHELALYVAGEKGSTSWRTPIGMTQFGDACGIEPVALVDASKMVTKVHETALQDSYRSIIISPIELAFFPRNY